MTKIYYIRHGQSEDNIAGLTSGAERDAALTDEGRSQAKAAGQALRGKQVDLIVCSPMQRAAETARIVAGEIGYDPAHIIEREEFIERFMGTYSGVPHEEYRQANESGNLHESLETTKSMFDRVSGGLEWLHGHPAENIVVVAHGGIGRAVWAVDQKRDHSEMYKREGFNNAEIYELTID